MIQTDKTIVKYLINNNCYEESIYHTEKDIHGNEKTVYGRKNSLSGIMIHSKDSTGVMAED